MRENDEKKAGDADSEQIVKMLNSIILRVLENGELNDIISILFDLMRKYRKVERAGKRLDLIVRCLLKLGNSLDEPPSSFEPERILFDFHHYLIDLGEEDLNTTTNAIGVKSIKILLNKLVKAYKEQIWEYYSAVEMHHIQDLHLQNWISAILKPFSVNSVQSHPHRQEKEPLAPTKYQSGNSTLQQLSEKSTPKKSMLIEQRVMEQIIENLKVPEKFEQNILLLYELILKNPGYKAFQLSV